MTMQALTPDELRLLAEAGGAAPSLHNSQPWAFWPTPDARGLCLSADPQRSVPLTDPDGRALHISLGAALFNLRLAALHLGREPAVRLLPHASDPHLVAVLDLSQPGADPQPYGRDLYRAITQRHSSRQPFANRDVPEAVLGELMAAAVDEGVVLSALEEDGVRRVLSLTAQAERRTDADLARMAETRSWLRVEQPATDGIPQAALGPQDHEAHVPMRSFTGRPSSDAAHSQRFEALPQLATLTTRADLPADWLRAGQAMQRVWLLATVEGVRVSVLHQAVEWPDTRWGLRDPAEGPGHVQLVLRIGYGPPGSATPRRPVAQTLDLSGMRNTSEGGEP
ncbi:Acg family FMN-binding oxidoreductase [Kitasatospora mediocidica]|uniref:Acg family FMN-binding oxidoreductase n=1 Tax=Kitasatospora mediocidica TaxID=58352 RepID=UPI0005666708|nr:nitroreductase family protein [Kitasatospora mediocidica]